MAKANYKTLGIIGGVGPLATADFFQKLLKAVGAAKDQDYPRVLVDCHSAIPDRTEALLGAGPNPTPEILDAARKLINSGAEVLAMPCNTAHAYYEQIQSQLNVPLVNMVEATIEHITQKFPGRKKVGFLGSNGSRKAEIYDQALVRAGLNPVNVSGRTQKEVMSAIYGPQGIKAGNFLVPQKPLLKAVQELIENGAEAIILGCTELPLILKQADVPLIDTTQVLAEKLLESASR